MKRPLNLARRSHEKPATAVLRPSLRVLAPSADHLLWVILALALGLRLSLWSLPLHQLANDEIEYVQVAFDLLAGRGWQFYERYSWLRAPLYPLFLAGSLALSRGDLHLAAIPNITLSLLNVALAHTITRELWGSRRAALIAASLSAVLLTFSTFASLYMLEILFATLLAATLLALLRYRRHPRPTIAALAGALLGAAALTRSLALPLLAPGCLYILAVEVAPLGQQVWQAKSLALKEQLRRAARNGAVFVLCCFLVIAPWTIRNYLAYGRFILVETGLSYNTWAFNEPREDMSTIFRTLEAIPNPAERADYAVAKGMQRLREDPAILLRKIENNWFALWRVKPIEDRFIQQDYYSDVGLSYFLAALIFDDALILLIMLAGSWGLVLAPGWRAKVLLGGWLVGTIVSILLTHGEARYRHALLPALLPYASWALSMLASKPLAASPHRRLALASVSWSRLSWLQAVQLAVCCLLSAFMAYTFLSAYPWQWAQQRVARGWLQLRGDLVLERGDAPAAIAAYSAAARAQPDSVDALIVLGKTYAAQGQLDAAEKAYRAAWALRPTYIPASTLLGDLLRRRGDVEGARQAFAGAYAPSQEIVDWAWANLAPPPATRIDAGDGLDFGYLDGVYPAEQQQGATVRWTNGEGRLRLAASQQTWLLRLRLAAPHPDAQPVTAQICGLGSCQLIEVGPTWRSYTLLVPPAPGTEQIVTVRSTSFVGAQDGRRLGLLLDWVTLSPTNLRQQ